MSGFINIDAKNIEGTHLCCAIADKKHQAGVDIKREWLKERIKEGHVFRRLDERGKVFIEYAPVEKAWVPVEGEGFMYIYCLWVAGSFKGKGYGRELLEYCVEDAKARGMRGVCAIAGKKKTPFLTDGAFLKRHGFKPADEAGEYQLVALTFDGAPPRFAEAVKKQSVDSDRLTIYFGMQCPYIPDCTAQIVDYCEREGIPLDLIAVDTLEKAKSVPCVFNNWAVFYGGRFMTVHLLNEDYLKKVLGR